MCGQKLDDIHARDTVGGTALIRAAEKGDKDKVKALATVGADVNAKNANMSALLRAAASGSTECVKVLLGSGADVNASDKRGVTALMAAIIVAAGAAEIDTDPARAVAAASIECVRMLIAAGVDLQAVNNDGKTALMMAVEANHVPCVKALVVAGADVDAKNNLGKTALDLARDNSDVAAILQGAERQSVSQTSLQAIVPEPNSQLSAALDSTPRIQIPSERSTSEAYRKFGFLRSVAGFYQVFGIITS